MSNPNNMVEGSFQLNSNLGLRPILEWKDSAARRRAYEMKKAEDEQAAREKQDKWQNDLLKIPGRLGQEFLQENYTEGKNFLDKYNAELLKHKDQIMPYETRREFEMERNQILLRKQARESAEAAHADIQKNFLSNPYFKPEVVTDLARKGYFAEDGKHKPDPETIDWAGVRQSIEKNPDAYNIAKVAQDLVKSQHENIAQRFSRTATHDIEQITKFKLPVEVSSNGQVLKDVITGKPILKVTDDLLDEVKANPSFNAYIEGMADREREKLRQDPTYIPRSEKQIAQSVLDDYVYADTKEVRRRIPAKSGGLSINNSLSGQREQQNTDQRYKHIKNIYAGDTPALKSLIGGKLNGAKVVGAEVEDIPGDKLGTFLGAPGSTPQTRPKQIVLKVYDGDAYQLDDKGRENKRVPKIPNYKKIIIDPNKEEGYSILNTILNEKNGDANIRVEQIMERLYKDRGQPSQKPASTPSGKYNYKSKAREGELNDI